MATNSGLINAAFTRLKGREARTRSIATRFTTAEEQQLLKKAEASGQSLREWSRDVLLRGAQCEAQSEMNLNIFTELVGIQLLLMDTLEPLLRGDRPTQDQIGTLFRRSQAAKAGKAQEILAKRREKKEK